MTFEEIRGNEAVKTALVGMVDSGRVPHAIMFNEDDGGGAFPICLAFLQYLYYGKGQNSKMAKLIHPDVHFVFPIQAHDNDTSITHIADFRELALDNPYFKENDLSDRIGAEGKQTGINVNEANFICDKLAFNSLEGGYISIVIYLPEKMNVTAANKLLKSLEEPAKNTVFLLITHSPEKVLQTIDSRCIHIRVAPEGLPEVSEKAGAAEFGDLFIPLMDAVTRRDLLSALDVGEKLAALPSRDKMKAFCAYAAENMRIMFLSQQGLGSMHRGSDVIQYAAKCKKTFPRNALGILTRASMLIERNVNPKILFTDMVNRIFTSI